MSKARAIKIDTDGSITEVKVNMTFPYLGLEMFGKDRLIQRVPAIGLRRWNEERTDVGKDTVMLVDESGLYHPTYKRNVLASLLYGCLDHGNEIAGPAYLVDEDKDDFLGLHESCTVEVVESLVEDFIPLQVARFAARVKG